MLTLPFKLLGSDKVRLSSQMFLDRRVIWSGIGTDN